MLHLNPVHILASLLFILSWLLSFDHNPFTFGTTALIIMSPFNSLILLCIVFASLPPSTSAQQYAGDVIPNSLPLTPGSELTYFRINDPAGKNNNLTLINYYSLQQDQSRLAPTQLQRAVVIIHGLNQDPGTYMSLVRSSQPFC